MLDRTKFSIDRDYVFRSFTIRLGFLLVIFLLLPYLLFLAFESADRRTTKLLMESVQREGFLVAQAIRRSLESFEEGINEKLDLELARFGGPGLNLKLFYQPQGEDDRLFYMAAYPTLDPDQIDAERQLLVDTGIFERLGDTCAGESQLALRFTNPAGREEILTSLTPVLLSKGCWIIVTAHETDEFLASSIGQAFWQTPAIQVAGVIYLIVSALAAWVLTDSRKNLLLIRSAARSMQEESGQTQSFAAINRVPEFDSVAQEIDRLVGALKTSQDLMRQNAEENAHAFKTPIAVIRQSLEPLKKVQLTQSRDSQRSLELIERSVDALDGLVTAARNIESLTADSLNPSQRAINLSAFMRDYCSSFKTIAEARGIELRIALEDNLFMMGNDEIIETIMENLLDNCLSFAPPQSAIHVSLQREAASAVIRVRDEGPGVSPENLKRIFDRYFSLRPDAKASSAPHFGLGLWLVRRNVESLGGVIVARNSDKGGLEINIGFPLALRH